MGGGLSLLFFREAEWFDSFEPDYRDTSIFIIGLIVGLVLCSILMSSIDSAVLAVIVLFAEGPAEFEQNYPKLSSEMREAYARTYPGYEKFELSDFAWRKLVMNAEFDVYIFS